MRKIDLLHQLQDFDSRIDGARAAVVRLEAEIADAGTIGQLTDDVQRAKEELQGLDTQQRDLELQAETHRGKIASDEGKLYGGRITNPKELESLQDEVAQDKRQLSTVETRILELMESIEEKTRRSNDLESALARETQSLSARHDGARTQLQQTQGTLKTLGAQRDSVFAQIDSALRPTYETLRRQKGGLAVATVQQRTCQACRVSLTPAQEQRARIGNDIVTCNSCGRILFVPLG
jgi:predicted  nucleic acid-binding Zn-ribbon protein